MQDVINILIDAQAQGYGGLLNGINLGEGLPTISFLLSWLYYIYAILYPIYTLR